MGAQLLPTLVYHERAGAAGQMGVGPQEVQVILSESVLSKVDLGILQAFQTAVSQGNIVGMALCSR